MEKKKHHYVWREYLRSWSNKELIFAYSKSQNKIFKPNLMGIAVERHFYSLHEFTLEEEAILKELVKLYSSQTALKINLKLVDLFLAYSRIKRLENEDEFNFDTDAKREKFSKIIKLIKTNSFEEYHSIIENYGSKIIKFKKIEDLKILEDGDELFKTMIYLCSQFLRTNKMKNMLDLVIKKNEFIIPKFTNLISLVFANSLGISLAQNENIKYVFYDNKTNIDFLTSDQPLMNLAFDYKDENGKVQNFEFYYPISSKVAILIHFKEQKEKYKNILISKQRVEEINKILFEYADEYVFAQKENHLEYYQNANNNL